MEAMIHMVFIGLGTNGSSGEMNHVKVDKENCKNILLNGNDRSATQSLGERDERLQKGGKRLISSALPII